MKKYIYGMFLALISVAMFTACSADEGTNEGNDSQANVLLYQYETSAPNDPDVDTRVRIATNSATQAAYMLTEKTDDYKARVASLTEVGYQDYVVENGKKLDKVNGASVVDSTLTNLTGDYTITVVAVGNGSKSSKSVNFVGVTWSDVAVGTYYFRDFGQLFGTDDPYSYSLPTTLQVNDSDPAQYRFKDLWGQGKHYKFSLTGQSGTLQNGHKIQVLTVSAQATPYSYGDYGTIYYADAKTHGDANATSYLRDDNVVMIPLTFYVSAGNLIPAAGYDQFVPNN